MSAKLQNDALIVDDGWIQRKDPGVIVKVVERSVLGSGVSSTRQAETVCGALKAREGWSGLDPEGYAANPKLVIDFYNERRKQLLAVKPNRGHELVSEMEKFFNVTVITQNIDNLHERAGSSHIIHLHGELSASFPRGRIRPGIPAPAACGYLNTVNFSFHWPRTVS